MGWLSEKKFKIFCDDDEVIEFTVMEMFNLAAEMSKINDDDIYSDIALKTADIPERKGGNS